MWSEEGKWEALPKVKIRVYRSPLLHKSSGNTGKNSQNQLFCKCGNCLSHRTTKQLNLGESSKGCELLTPLLPQPSPQVPTSHLKYNSTASSQLQRLWKQQPGRMDRTVWSSLKSLPIASLLSCVSGRSLENPHSGNLYSCKPHRRKHKAKVSQLGSGKGFSAMTPKAQATEEKQTKWTLGKYLNFVHPKLLYIHRGKRPPTEWER